MPDRHHEIFGHPDWRLYLVRRTHKPDAGMGLRQLLLILLLLAALWTGIIYAAEGVVIWWKAIFG